MGGSSGPERTKFCCAWRSWYSLTAKSVKGTSLVLEGIDNIHSCHCLPLLQENLQYTMDLFVDQSRDMLNTTSAGKMTDGWLCDTLDVIMEQLPVALSALFPRPLPPLPSPDMIVVLENEI